MPKNEGKRRLTDVIAYRRFIGPNMAVDPIWVPVSSAGLKSIEPVWINALNKGDYVRIELMLSNGRIVKVKKLSPEGRVRRSLRRQADEAMSRMMARELSRNLRQTPMPTFDPFERG